MKEEEAMVFQTCGRGRRGGGEEGLSEGGGVGVGDES